MLVCFTGAAMVARDRAQLTFVDQASKRDCVLEITGIRTLYDIVLNDQAAEKEVQTVAKGVGGGVTFLTPTAQRRTLFPNGQRQVYLLQFYALAATASSMAAFGPRPHYNSLQEQVVMEFGGGGVLSRMGLVRLNPCQFSATTTATPTVVYTSSVQPRDFRVEDASGSEFNLRMITMVPTYSQMSNTSPSKDNNHGTMLFVKSVLISYHDVVFGAASLPTKVLSRGKGRHLAITAENDKTPYQLAAEVVDVMRKFRAHIICCPNFRLFWSLIGRLPLCTMEIPSSVLLRTHQQQYHITGGLSIRCKSAFSANRAKVTEKFDVPVGVIILDAQHIREMKFVQGFATGEASANIVDLLIEHDAIVQGKCHQRGLFQIPQRAMTLTRSGAVPGLDQVLKVNSDVHAGFFRDSIEALEAVQRGMHWLLFDEWGVFEAASAYGALAPLCTVQQALYEHSVYGYVNRLLWVCCVHNNNKKNHNDWYNDGTKASCNNKRKIDKDDKEEEEGTRGGLLLVNKTGVHKSSLGVALFDFASMYPSICRTFALCPGTLADTIAIPGDTTVVGTISDLIKRRENSSSVVNVLMDRLVALRTDATAAGSTARANTFKLIANAIVGVMGSDSSPFYAPHFYDTVVAIGRFLLKRMVAFVTQTSTTRKLAYQVIGGQTDGALCLLTENPHNCAALAKSGKSAHLVAVDEIVNGFNNGELGGSSLRIALEAFFHLVIVPPGQSAHYIGMTKLLSSSSDGGGEDCWSVRCVGTSLTRSAVSLHGAILQRTILLRKTLDLLPLMPPPNSLSSSSSLLYHRELHRVQHTLHPDTGVVKANNAAHWEIDLASDMCGMPVLRTAESHRAYFCNVQVEHLGQALAQSARVRQEREQSLSKVIGHNVWCVPPCPIEPLCTTTTTTTTTTTVDVLPLTAEATIIIYNSSPPLFPRLAENRAALVAFAAHWSWLLEGGLDAEAEKESFSSGTHKHHNALCVAHGGGHKCMRLDELCAKTGPTKAFDGILASRKLQLDDDGTTLTFAQFRAEPPLLLPDLADRLVSSLKTQVVRGMANMLASHFVVVNSLSLGSRGDASDHIAHFLLGEAVSYLFGCVDAKIVVGDVHTLARASTIAASRLSPPMLELLRAVQLRLVQMSLVSCVAFT